MTETMTSIERVQATIEGRKPDRVPVDLHNFQPAAAMLGVPLPEIFKSGDLLAEAMIKAWREFKHDMILLENGTACNAQACGVTVVYDEDSAPVATEPVLHDLADIANLEVPDPQPVHIPCRIAHRHISPIRANRAAQQPRIGPVRKIRLPFGSIAHFQREIIWSLNY
jgi:uroporphyrinogen-III decarboxylase